MHAPAPRDHRDPAGPQGPAGVGTAGPAGLNPQNNPSGADTLEGWAICAK
jgi:hypothetical protein